MAALVFYRHNFYAALRPDLDSQADGRACVATAGSATNTLLSDLVQADGRCSP